MQQVYFPQNERVLFLSVIEKAIVDATEPKPLVREAALDWLLQDQVDFPRICDMAGLDSAYLRRNLASHLSVAPSPIVPGLPSEHSLCGPQA